MQIKPNLSFAAILSLVLLSPLFAQNSSDKSDNPVKPLIDVYISSGDNHYLGASLAVDSPQSLHDSFEMLKTVLGTKRIYWRGLQEATSVETLYYRPECYRSATFFEWVRTLITEKKLEPLVVKTAHGLGMELWGVGTLGDWGNTADTPGFTDFPSVWESTLRREHPEWVPVDKYGYRKQGGTIELAYPEARKALVDLHTKVAVEAGYDGIIFLSYVENFSMRFQDEFGYSEPIVKEFKKRYGIDIRTQEFTKFASEVDWYKLRGEYVTMYLKELKDSLSKHGIKLGMFINPRYPRYPGNWATLNQSFFTYGHVYFDIDKWSRDNIVDLFAVYGASAVQTQLKTIYDMLWWTRDTNSQVTFVTSSPAAPQFQQFYQKGMRAIFSISEDADYFSRGGYPHQPASVLKNGTIYQKMGFLSQVIHGTSKASAEQIIPLTKIGEYNNVVLRRLALLALSKTGGGKDAVAAIEARLKDPELGVRCIAIEALRYTNGPESAQKIFESLREIPIHPMREMARTAFAAIRPVPWDTYVKASADSSPVIRNAAIRAFGSVGPRDEDLPILQKSLRDPDAYVRYSAALALASSKSPKAIDILCEATKSKDPAAANRAAKSLAEFISRNSPAAADKRQEILACITELFSKSGDSSKGRNDEEWGYRVSGEALLAFGQQGEDILRKFMAQTKDKKLAERAWYVLYIREKAGPNKFNFVTEKESDEAFRHRPLFMKKNRSVRLKQTFDSAEFKNTPAKAASLGNFNSVVGRWSAFATGGVELDSKRYRSTPRSAKLIRGGYTLLGHNAQGVKDGQDYEASIWIYRDTPQSAFAMEIIGTKPALKTEMKMYVNEEGKLMLWNQVENKWVDTGMTVSSKQWTKIMLFANRIAGKCTAAIKPSSGPEQNSEVSVPLTPCSEVNRVLLLPQGPKGSATLVDDITLEELF